jgi:hypothetical protein
VSSETNTKLVKVAEELVRTGELPTASTQKKSTSGR